ncbi:hypothetical protein KIN20_001537 [Parelaphostrongylus tenuis]|uniref:Uncharacterized protein n=1 Tax=Parelaphostrongylus tenuis TaxID=148309 RepID=A0AAD5MCP7_PARTN|nr:hypothetical protein KIN20_001537 [Parelaphostrongylus tenuis]
MQLISSKAHGSFEGLKRRYHQLVKGLFNFEEPKMKVALRITCEHWELTATGFALPVAMVYTEMHMVSGRVTGIATSKERAQAFVQLVVIQTFYTILLKTSSKRVANEYDYAVWGP